MSDSQSGLLLLLVFSSVTTIVLLIAGLGWWVMTARQRGRVRHRVDGGDIAGQEESDVTVRLLTEDPGDSRRAIIALREWAINQIESAGENWTLGRLLSICAVCAFVGLLAGLRLSRALPAALTIPCATVGCGALPFLHLSRKQKKRVAKFEEQLPEALDFLARSMRAGNALPISLELLAGEAEEPLKTEFTRVTNEIRLGSPMLSSLQNLLRRMPVVDLRMFVSAVLLQRETGGNLSDLLNRLAATIRDRFRLRGQVQAAAAQGKLSARVLTALPILVLLGILLLSPDYLKVMSEDAMGRKLLAAAGIGQVLGYLVMSKIVQIKV